VVRAEPRAYDKPNSGKDLEVVEYAGSRLLVERLPTGFRCPFCDAILFTEKDLIAHIIAHAEDLVDKRKASPKRH
jgi:hypothetical protein